MIPERMNDSLKEWFSYGRAFLEESGIAEAKTDAWLLLEHVAGITRSYYYMHMQEELDAGAASQYDALLRRRAARIPLQYLTGEAWCYGNCFAVSHSVLIPRQDTEIVIEEAAKRLRAGMHVLDLCTGSGCILISLLKQKSVTGVGTDLSAEALAVARGNAVRHRVQAEFIQSDLFAAVEGTFDLIVSNPPYIPSEVIERLDPEVRDHEPRMALDGGEDGLDFYRRIIDRAEAFLRAGGWLCLEIGFDQGDAVRALLERAAYREIEVIQDYAGLDRVVLGQRGGQSPGGEN